MRFPRPLSTVPLLLIAFAAGCADNQPSHLTGVASLSTKAPHAECLVCKKNADLACIDVDVDGKTPHLDYQGTRYYFCSDDCKTEFQKNPEKFLKAK